MITQDAFIIGKSLIVEILQKFEGINKTRHRFITHILMLYLSHRGRINFMPMQRQGGILRNTSKNNKSMPLSIMNVKTELQNRNRLFRIFSIYGFSHKLIKINKIYKQVMNLGKIAA